MTLAPADTDSMVLAVMAAQPERPWWSSRWVSYAINASYDRAPTYTQVSRSLGRLAERGELLVRRVENGREYKLKGA